MAFSLRLSKVLGNLRTSTKQRVWSCSTNGYKASACAWYSTSTKSDNPLTSVTLKEPPSGFPSPVYAPSSIKSHETKVTTLHNGLRVASENKFGQFSTVGVLIDSGSRYEIGYPSGITHFLEKLAFSASPQYASRDHVLQSLEKHGGICDCQGSRDTLIYAISAETSGLTEVMDILSEAALRPLVTEEEMEDSRAAIQFELESLEMRPDPEPILVELIHAAAYSDNTLGLPKICPSESVPVIDRSTLLTYMKHHHSPDRMVIAGVGMEHESLVEMAQKYFVEKTPVWETECGKLKPDLGLDKSISQYTGGLVQVEKDLSNVSLGPNPMPELAHCVIGLESCSHKDPDFIAFCVLNMMMGGGGSFSAGGPGKGMYTRLYLNVLNRFHWMYNATAYNHAYNDSGVFCIHASAHPSALKEVIEVIVKELVMTQNGIVDSELKRAKTQLQSMLLMNLESRPVAFEDVGRQVLSNDVRRTAQYYFDQIGQITEEDITRVARRMLRTPPAIAAYGTLSNLPSYDSIATALGTKDGKMTKRFSLFR